MSPTTPFFIKKGNIKAVPILHYTMEMAAQVNIAFHNIQPDCVAVELPETMAKEMLHAASRLPDISAVVAYSQDSTPFYYLCEPCDPAFEGLRCALDHRIPGLCIDLDVDHYPDVKESLPDPYVVQRIGLKHYYSAYKKIALDAGSPVTKQDQNRELYMARRLKELSFYYENILFVGGMAHVARILDLVDSPAFPQLMHARRNQISLCTLTEKSCREVLPEFGWISAHYEAARSHLRDDLQPFLPPCYSNKITFPPDRQKLIYSLYKEAGKKYSEATGGEFQGYHLRNTMKFVRNYALITQKLMPDLFQLLSAAKGCVDHNYAYEVWELGTDYLFLRNLDNLPALDLTVEEVWGNRKIIQFHRKQKSHKGLSFHKKRKDRSSFRFSPPGPFTICSYPREDKIIENFGEYLKKKSVQIATEEGAHTVPFTASLEDGLDVKETIRHWHEKQLYVKVRGKPPGRASSLVMIFSDDSPQEGKIYEEKYPWKTTWIGEHNQESDMALYATEMRKNIVGPGICRCEYGGFMMTSPPRRLFDVWSDPDYASCRSKAEVLLMSAIDYAVDPMIAYVAERPPRSFWKSYAGRFSKKIIYIPIGQISAVMINKIRIFHVLDGHDRRAIADEYIW